MEPRKTDIIEKSGAIEGVDDAARPVAIIDEETLRGKIYEIRGQKVMLDFDLAEIYGYTTKRFNEQVKRNIEKFQGDDFMFQLTQDEELAIRSQFATGSHRNDRYHIRAFTEQGTYMLMTVMRRSLHRGLGGHRWLSTQAAYARCHRTRRARQSPRN